MFKPKGKRDLSFVADSIHVLWYKGQEVSYAWGAGESGKLYGVLIDGDWMVFDELEDAVKAKIKEGGAG